MVVHDMSSVVQPGNVDIYTLAFPMDILKQSKCFIIESPSIIVCCAFGKIWMIVTFLRTFLFSIHF